MQKDKCDKTKCVWHDESKDEKVCLRCFKKRRLLAIRRAQAKRTDIK